MSEERGPRRSGGVHESGDDSGLEIDHKMAGFWVGEACYAVDIMRIKEVIRAAEYPVRPVPRAPGIVEGVVQLRGVVIPVIDLRKRFGARIDPGAARVAKLVIVSVRGRIVGLCVDQIVGELRVPSEALRPAPSMLRSEEAGEFFSHVFNTDDRMVFVLNLEAIIDPKVPNVVLPEGPHAQAAPTAQEPAT